MAETDILGARPESKLLPTLEGGRVRLRHITAADAPELRTIFGDPAVVRFMGVPLLCDDEQVHRFLQDIASGLRDDTLYQWGITLPRAELLVGTCTLAQISWSNRRAEIGFALGKAHWGFGLMRAALPPLFDHAFTTLGLNRLEADVDPRNERSLRLLELLGFEREGYHRERHFVAGEPQDSVLLGLLAIQWRVLRERHVQLPQH